MATVFVNDPLAQTHNPASSGHKSHLTIVLVCSILKNGDGRTTCLKIVINTGRDCKLAEWIKNGSCCCQNLVLQVASCASESFLTSQKKIIKSSEFSYLPQVRSETVIKQLNFEKLFDPPGHGRICGHYFHARCPYVRHKNKQTPVGGGAENKTTDTMHENNDHLLATAWWVILKSHDLLKKKFSMH